MEIIWKNIIFHPEFDIYFTMPVLLVFKNKAVLLYFWNVPHRIKYA